MTDYLSQFDAFSERECQKFRKNHEFRDQQLALGIVNLAIDGNGISTKQPMQRKQFFQQYEGTDADYVQSRQGTTTQSFTAHGGNNQGDDEDDRRHGGGGNDDDDFGDDDFGGDEMEDEGDQSQAPPSTERGDETEDETYNERGDETYNETGDETGDEEGDEIVNLPTPISTSVNRSLPFPMIASSSTSSYEDYVPPFDFLSREEQMSRRSGHTETRNYDDQRATEVIFEDDRQNRLEKLMLSREEQQRRSAPMAQSREAERKKSKGPNLEHLVSANREFLTNLPVAQAPRQEAINDYLNNEDISTEDRDALMETITDNMNQATAEDAIRVIDELIIKIKEEERFLGSGRNRNKDVVKIDVKEEDGRFDRTNNATDLTTDTTAITIEEDERRGRGRDRSPVRNRQETRSRSGDEVEDTRAKTPEDDDEDEVEFTRARTADERNAEGFANAEVLSGDEEETKKGIKDREPKIEDKERRIMKKETLGKQNKTKSIEDARKKDISEPLIPISDRIVKINEKLELQAKTSKSSVSPFTSRKDVKNTKDYIKEIQSQQSSLREELFKARTKNDKTLISQIKSQQDKLEKLEENASKYGVRPLKQRGAGKATVDSVDDKKALLRKLGMKI